MKKQRPLSIQFRAQYRVDPARPPILEDDLAAMFQLRQHLRQFSAKLTEWFLGGSSREEALLYSAFDENGPTSALTAVLNERMRQERDELPPMRSVGLWNGQEQVDGASTGLFYRQVEAPSAITFGTRLRDVLTYGNVLSVTGKIVDIWKPVFVAVEPPSYDPVFKDRPGVGWMLYLPRVLEARHVPEARALVPVTSKDDEGRDKRIGTIVVSVIDGPFSDDDPEHVEVAHAIEVRLVDQDLLPRYLDL